VSLEFSTSDAAATCRAGELLGRLLLRGDVIALAGDLGAGKTQLVKGVALALGVGEPVTSPTFNLLAVHPGELPLYHFDLYRLEREADLEDIGFYETIEGDGASFVEWGDRFPASLPADHLLVVVHRTGDDERRFELVPSGARAGALAEGWLAAVHAEGDSA
jgi:tRNA threonylcarbamoyladenosine biosynthesis protein TsaE